MSNSKDKVRSIRFDADDLKRLEKLAREDDSNVSQIIRRLVRRYLEADNCARVGNEAKL